MKIVIVSALLLIAGEGSACQEPFTLNPSPAKPGEGGPKIVEGLQKLLDAQIAVRDATAKLDKATAEKLSEKQKAIVTQSTAMIAKLKGDGSAVAFTEVFETVLADMKRVRTRLAKADGGKATQALEVEIIDMLKDMIDALTKSH